MDRTCEHRTSSRAVRFAPELGSGSPSARFAAIHRRIPRLSLAARSSLRILAASSARLASIASLIAAASARGRVRLGLGPPEGRRRARRRRRAHPRHLRHSRRQQPREPPRVAPRQRGRTVHSNPPRVCDVEYPARRGTPAFLATARRRAERDGLPRDALERRAFARLRRAPREILEAVSQRREGPRVVGVSRGDRAESGDPLGRREAF